MQTIQRASESLVGRIHCPRESHSPTPGPFWVPSGLRCFVLADPDGPPSNPPSITVAVLVVSGEEGRGEGRAWGQPARDAERVARDIAIWWLGCGDPMKRSLAVRTGFPNFGLLNVVRPKIAVSIKRVTVA